LQFAAAVLFAVTLLVAGLVVAFRAKDDKAVNASNNASTTTSVTADPGIYVPTSAPPEAAATTTTTTTSKPKPAAAATTAATVDDAAELHCVTTTASDPTPTPDDWATYWQTKPDPPQNKGLSLKICVDDLTPKVGQVLTLNVLADDPDAKIGTGDCDIYVTWDSNTGSKCRDTVAVPTEPKPTPKAEHGRVTKTYTHTYNASGDHTIDVSAWSGPDSPDRHPYASYNSIELQVRVHK
jgi:hypothetical protein